MCEPTNFSRAQLSEGEPSSVENKEQAEGLQSVIKQIGVDALQPQKHIDQQRVPPTIVELLDLRKTEAAQLIQCHSLFEGDDKSAAAELSSIIEGVGKILSSCEKDVVFTGDLAKLLAHIHGDFIAKSTDLEGMPFYQAIDILNRIFTSDTFKNALSEMQIPLEHVQKASAIAEKSLGQAAPIAKELYELAGEWAVAEDGFKDAEKIARLLQLSTEVTAKAAALASGESLFIPIGWVTKWGGHAMFCEFCRDDDSSYTVCIYNTGAGLEFHEKHILDNKVKYSPIVTYRHVPQGDIFPRDVQGKLCPDFIQALFELSSLPPPSEDGKDAYGAPYIYGLFSVLSPYKDISDPELQGFSTAQRQEQRGGTCSWQVSKVIARMGFADKEEAKRSFHTIKWVTLLYGFSSYRQVIHDNSAGGRRARLFLCTAAKKLIRNLIKRTRVTSETLPPLSEGYIKKVYATCRHIIQEIDQAEEEINQQRRGDNNASCLSLTAEDVAEQNTASSAAIGKILSEITDTKQPVIVPCRTVSFVPIAFPGTPEELPAALEALEMRVCKLREEGRLGVERALYEIAEFASHILVPCQGEGAAYWDEIEDKGGCLNRLSSLVSLYATWAVDINCTARPPSEAITAATLYTACHYLALALDNKQQGNLVDFGVFCPLTM